MINSPNGHSVFLFGCKENPESIYELFNTEGNLSWRKLLQTLTYPRYNTVAMLIPDELVTCNNLESTTVTSTMRTLSHSETLISESASFNLYIWLALICSLLIGLLITAIKHFRKGKVDGRRLLTCCTGKRFAVLRKTLSCVLRRGRISGYVLEVVVVGHGPSV